MEVRNTSSNRRGSIGADLSVRKVFSTGQVAAILHVAPRTVSNWMEKGLLRGYRIPGSNDRRFERDEIIQFAGRNGIPIPEELRLGEVLVLLISPEEACCAKIEDSCAQALMAKGIKMRFVRHNSIFDSGVAFHGEVFRVVAIDFGIGRLESISIAKSIGCVHGKISLKVYGMASEDENDLENLNHGLFDRVWKKPLPVSEIAEALSWDLVGLLGLKGAYAREAKAKLPL